MTSPPLRYAIYSIHYNSHGLLPRGIAELTEEQQELIEVAIAHRKIGWKYVFSGPGSELEFRGPEGECEEEPFETRECDAVADRAYEQRRETGWWRQGPEYDKDASIYRGWE